MRMALILKLLKEGDLITGADGAPLMDAAALMDAIASAGEESVTLSVRRVVSDMAAELARVLFG